VRWSGRVGSGADGSSTKSGGVDTLLAVDGVGHSYTISIHKGGLPDAQNVSVADLFPAGFTEGTASPSVGSFSSNTWSVGTLASGDRKNVVKGNTVAAAATGDHKKTGTATSSTGGTNHDETTAENSALG